MTTFLDAYATERARLLRDAEQLEQRWREIDSAPEVGAGVGAGDDIEGILAQEITTVRRALAAEQFSIGLFGLIKRGKSTLLNALVGREVSAVSVTPETAVPVYVEHGEEQGAEVHLHDGTVRIVAVEDAVRFTSQQHNPGNELGVVLVKQRIHSPLLEHGVTLIDTPGLDDAHADELYTQRTLEELDRVDAGVVTFLSPPSVGTTEMHFLQQVATRGLEHVVFVCNMYPQHFHDPEVRRDVLEYIQRQVAARSSSTVEILPVCALDGWEGRRDGDLERWVTSGVPQVLATVEDVVVATARRNVLDRAAVSLERAALAMREQVRWRRDLLTDPDARHAQRLGAEQRAQRARRELERALAIRVAEADRQQRQLRHAVEQFFHEAETSLRKAEDSKALESALRGIRRETELRAATAARGLAESLRAVVNHLQQDVAKVVEADDELVVDTGDLQLAVTEALSSLSIRAEATRLDDGVVRSLGSAAAGGALAGGIGLVAVGALFGPLALIGGALAGWRLGGARGLGPDTEGLRELGRERVRALGQDVLRAFDAAAQHALDVLRDTAHLRIQGYVRDLLAPIDRADQLADDATAASAEAARCEQALDDLETILAETEQLHRQLASSIG